MEAKVSQSVRTEWDAIRPCVENLFDYLDDRLCQPLPDNADVKQVCRLHNWFGSFAQSQNQPGLLALSQCLHAFGNALQQGWFRPQDVTQAQADWQHVIHHLLQRNLKDACAILDRKADDDAPWPVIERNPPMVEIRKLDGRLDTAHHTLKSAANVLDAGERVGTPLTSYAIDTRDGQRFVSVVGLETLRQQGQTPAAWFSRLDAAQERPFRHLNQDEYRALETYARYYGEAWRDRLAMDWSSAGYSMVLSSEVVHRLQVIRNDFGMPWLADDQQIPDSLLMPQPSPTAALPRLRG